MNDIASLEPITPLSSVAEDTPLTFAEYFAGIGLFRMGLETAGWRTAYANDWDVKRAQIYQGFFRESYHVENVFSVAAEHVPTTTLATCSFPCIDLSLAGKHEGINGKHSGAFWGFHDILSQQGKQAPPIVLLENVMGWLYSNGGEDFYATVKSLNRLGYVCDVFMLDARSFVPQSRPRLFVVGVRSDVELGDPAYLKYRSKRLLPARLRNLIIGSHEIQWRHFNVPEPPPYKDSGLSEHIIERIPPDDSRWWHKEMVHKHLAMMSPSHLARVKHLARQEAESFRTFFRRRRSEGQRAEVRSDDIAGCLRTAVGGSGKQFLVAAGNDSIRMRTLTAREYARLQGVPDGFPIVSNSERQSLDAFGDAVCVPVVSWIAENVLTPLAHKLGLYENGYRITGSSLKDYEGSSLS